MRRTAALLDQVGLNPLVCGLGIEGSWLREPGGAAPHIQMSSAGEKRSAYTRTGRPRRQAAMPSPGYRPSPSTPPPPGLALPGIKRPTALPAVPQTG